MGLYIVPQSRNFLSLTGGTVSGETLFSSSLSANTYFSGVTSLEQIVYNIASNFSGENISIQNGLNTYTGGTNLNPSINISAITVDFLFVSGNSILNNLSTINLSGNAIFSGSTNLNDIFSSLNHTHQFSSILNTAHTHSISSIENLTNVLNTKVNKSGDTMIGGLFIPSLSATSLSGGVIFSGTSNLYDLFSHIGHTHSFSSILNTAHTHNILEVDNLLSSFNTKINKSGDTMTGGLFTPSLSATTLSGNSIFSGSTNLNDIFSPIGHTHQFSSILNTAHTHSIFGIDNLTNVLNTKVNKSGDTMTGGLFTPSLSASTLSGSSIFSGSTNLNDIFSSLNHTHQFSSILNTAHTHSISEIENLSNLLNTKVNKSGDTMTGGLFITGLSANTIQCNSLSGIVTQMVVADTSGNLLTQAIPSVGQSTVIRNGLNTYTGGSASDYIINVSALTINTLTASGNSIFTGNLSGGSSFSANSIFSGNTNLNDLFSSISHTHQLSQILNTAHTHSINEVDNVVNLFNTKINRSGDTMTGGLISLFISASTISGGTISSGSTNLYEIFSDIDHTHEFSLILNTAHTHSINEIENVVNLFNTKVNRSGDTMTGGLITSSLSANTLSGGIISSGSTNLYEIFSNTGHTHEFVSIINTAHTHSINEINNLNNIFNTKVNRSGDTITGQLNSGSLSSDTISGTTYYSGSTLLGTVILNIINDNAIHSLVSNETIIPKQSNVVILGGTVGRSFVGGGYNHLIVGGSFNFIGNGNQTKSLGGSYNFIGNGYGNYVGNAASQYGFVGNGSLNRLYSNFSSIINGNQNFVHLDAEFGTVVNGRQNSAHAKYSSVSNGINNKVDNYSSYSFISSGKNNLINKTTLYSFILNGYGNLINSGLTNVSIINGRNITGSSSYTVYVEQLNIQSASTGGSLMLTYNPINGNVHTQTIPITSLSSSINNGLNTFTAGTPGFQTVNISAATLDNLIVSGYSYNNSLSATTLSGGTIYSGNTNLNSIFSNINHNHEFSTILNTAHTHTIGNIDNLQSVIDTKVNKSGDTMTGGLTALSLSATTLSGGTIYSGSTPFENIFTTNISTSGIGTSLFINKTGSILNIKSISAGTNVSLIDDGSNITINSSGGGGSSGSVNNGINTFTAGTSSFQSVNVTGLTIDNLIVSGNTSLQNISTNSISGGTFYGDGSNLTGITGSIGISVDGAGSPITTGIKGFTVINQNKKIVGWNMISDLSGNCAIDIWKNTTVPTSANTITGTEMPMLSNQQINSDYNLTSWNTTLLENDIIYFNVISATTITKLSLIIKTINF